MIRPWQPDCFEARIDQPAESAKASGLLRRILRRIPCHVAGKLGTRPHTKRAMKLSNDETGLVLEWNRRPASVWNRFCLVQFYVYVSSTGPSPTKKAVHLSKGLCERNMHSSNALENGHFSSMHLRMSMTSATRMQTRWEPGRYAAQKD